MKNSYPPIIVVGSQNVRKDDRYLNREEILPVTVIYNKQVNRINYFNEWGEFGVSSMAWDNENPFEIYISNGSDLKLLNLKSKDIKEINIPNLKGVHELDYIEDKVYISNTAYDEIVIYDTDEQIIKQRIELAELNKEQKEQLELKKTETVVDKFHINQVFKGFNGELYFLAHHVTGRQFLKTVAGALLKSQGNGGVYNLDQDLEHNLSLKAPHSVRKVNNNYWVFNSAHSIIQVHNKNWEKVDEIKTRGFGRGACLDDIESLFFAGISPARKRYLDAISFNRKTAVPGVEVFSVTDRTSIEFIEVPFVEQINNVYKLSDEQFELIIQL